MAQNRDKIMKGILSGITGFVDAQAQKQKLKAQLLFNEMKLRGNWLYKLREMQTKQQLERENNQWAMDEFQKRFGSGEGGDGRIPGITSTGGFTPTLTTTPSGKNMLSLGKAEGGEVLAPEGSRFEDGQILDASGNRIGEYEEPTYGIDEKSLLNPQNRQRVSMTPSGKLSTQTTPFAEAMYGKLLKLEKLQGLNPQQKAMKERLEAKLFGGVKGMKKEITPSQALTILSDPFKSQHLKKNYPEMYKKIETIAKQTPDKEITDTNNLEETTIDTNW